MRMKLNTAVPGFSYEVVQKACSLNMRAKIPSKIKSGPFLGEGVTMKTKLIVSCMLFLASASAFANWHTLSKVTKVTVMGDRFYVRGTSPTGYSCTDEASYYGTLAHDSTDPGHKEYYSLALLAQATEKGMACFIYNTLSNGVCRMENCHIL